MSTYTYHDQIGLPVIQIVDGGRAGKVTVTVFGDQVGKWLNAVLPAATAAAPRRIINDGQANALRIFWDAVDQRVRPNPLPCERVPDMWYSDDQTDRLIAIVNCQVCPVRAACDQLAATEHWGIWAATPRDGKQPPDECEWCGNGYKHSGRNSRYCGETCRREAHRAQKKASQERRRA